MSTYSISGVAIIFDGGLIYSTEGGTGCMSHLGQSGGMPPPEKF